MYIVSVDIGTSTIRSCLYDSDCRLIGKCEQQVHVKISGQEGEVRVELEPEQIFQQFKEVVNGTLSLVDEDAPVTMALCCQRNSIICWNKRTLQDVTKFICWNDGRANNACEMWNKSFLLRSKELQELLRNDELAFGCLDSWLLLRLSKGCVDVMESSCASSTGMYDPFINKFNHTVLRIIGFPLKLLPPLIDSVGELDPATGKRAALAEINPTIFGRKISISVILADQQAAHFGAGCWEKGDIKISLGTGTFVSVNTKDKAHASMQGLYPVVGWRINQKSTFLAEGMQHYTASLLTWAKNIGLLDDVKESSSMALSVHSTNGLVFIPAFGGLQTPINDGNICAGFLGLRPDTTKQQMVRAILESIAFRVYQVIMAIEDEVHFKLTHKIRICGGVSANNFICQSISDLLGRPVERLQDEGFVASRGVAMLAGMAQGLWTEDQLPNLIEISTTFYPNSESQFALKNTYKIWLKAVKGCSNFYS
ncbi:hypothetical protein WR25_26664 [Diploscapter pachys]|uniref:glycerol kinase n=1 Tax=Diploscapter pachys TaxID=2018661 RepID=A0A2A2KI32_9BILA|nr:hypothetical protein WR25_26664 [Diploscapter pachys]